MKGKNLTQEQLDEINTTVASGDGGTSAFELTDGQRALIDCMEGEQTPTTNERLEIIDRQCEALFHENRMFTPMYPWVFILVCEKEQQVGHIILPGKQNKTVHEGIVLATWKDKEVDRGITHYDGRKVTRHEILHSDMTLGDHVIFHHWAGLPAPGYDADRFRVVRERDWKETEQGGIFGKIEYADAQTAPIAQILEMIQNATGDWDASRLVTSQIDDKFVVVDRESKSVTLSGR